MKTSNRILLLYAINNNNQRVIHVELLLIQVSNKPQSTCKTNLKNEYENVLEYSSIQDLDFSERKTRPPPTSSGL